MKAREMAEEDAGVGDGDARGKTGNCPKSGPETKSSHEAFLQTLFLLCSLFPGGDRGSERAETRPWSHSSQKYFMDPP